MRFSLERVRGSARPATLVVVFERDRMAEKVEQSMVYYTRRSMGQLAVPTECSTMSPTR